MKRTKLRELSRRFKYTSKHALKRSLVQAGVYGTTIGILDVSGFLDHFIPPNLHESIPAAAFATLSGGTLGLVTGTVDATMRYNELKRILKDPRIPKKDKILIEKELIGDIPNNKSTVLEDINMLINGVKI